MKKFFCVFGVMLTGSLLFGCSVFGPVPEFHRQFVIEKLPPVIHSHPTQESLTVARPVTGPIYDTTQIAWSGREWEVNYFSKSRWGALPSEMIQDLLVQMFQASHRYRAVFKMPVSAHDSVLSSEIIRFRENLTGDHPVFEFVLRVDLMEGEGVHDIRQFSVKYPLSVQSPYAVAVAANEAVSIVLHQVELFCLQKNHH